MPSLISLFYCKNYNQKVHIKKNENIIISTLVKVIRCSGYIERDERALNEMLVFERMPNGSTGAVTGEHDDLLMTRAIGLHICLREMEIPTIVSKYKQQNRVTAPRTVSAATLT